MPRRQQRASSPLSRRTCWMRELGFVSRADAAFFAPVLQYTVCHCSYAHEANLDGTYYFGVGVFTYCGNLNITKIGCAIENWGPNFFPSFRILTFSLTSSLPVGNVSTTLWTQLWVVPAVKPQSAVPTTKMIAAPAASKSASAAGATTSPAPAAVTAASAAPSGMAAAVATGEASLSSPPSSVTTTTPAVTLASASPSPSSASAFGRRLSRGDVAGISIAIAVAGLVVLSVAACLALRARSAALHLKNFEAASDFTGSPTQHGHRNHYGGVGGGFISERQISEPLVASAL